MNVTCPNCATVYRVDPAKVPEAGVRARCNICSAVFAVHRDGASQERGASTHGAPAATVPTAPPASPIPTPPRPSAPSTPPPVQAPMRQDPAPPVPAAPAAPVATPMPPSPAYHPTPVTSAPTPPAA